MPIKIAYVRYLFKVIKAAIWLWSVDDHYSVMNCTKNLTICSWSKVDFLVGEKELLLCQIFRCVISFIGCLKQSHDDRVSSEKSTALFIVRKFCKEFRLCDKNLPNMHVIRE